MRQLQNGNQTMVLNDMQVESEKTMVPDIYPIYMTPTKPIIQKHPFHNQIRYM